MTVVFYDRQPNFTNTEGDGGAVVGDGGVGDNVYVPEMGVGELGELGGV